MRLSGFYRGRSRAAFTRSAAWSLCCCWLGFFLFCLLSSSVYLLNDVAEIGTPNSNPDNDRAEGATTVLAFQHWKTFRKRFAPFPVRVEMVRVLVVTDRPRDGQDDNDSWEDRRRMAATDTRW